MNDRTQGNRRCQRNNIQHMTCRNAQRSGWLEELSQPFPSSRTMTANMTWRDALKEQRIKHKVWYKFGKLLMLTIFIHVPYPGFCDITYPFFDSIVKRSGIQIIFRARGRPKLLPPPPPDSFGDLQTASAAPGLGALPPPPNSAKKQCPPSQFQGQMAAPSPSRVVLLCLHKQA